MNVIDEKIGLNLKEASKMLGINEKLMSDLTKIKGFPCIKFKKEELLLIRINYKAGLMLIVVNIFKYLLLFLVVGLTFFKKHVIIKKTLYLF